MLRVLRSPITTAILFVAAAVLLAFGGINAVQATPNKQSTVYAAQMELTNIHTALTERTDPRPGGERVVREGNDKLLTTLLKDGEQFQVGKKYFYELGVKNVGDKAKRGIDQYVRVTVSKYWVLTDSNGNALKDDTGKVVTLDPSLIKIEWNDGKGSPWSIDEDASAKENSDKYKERTVLNYSKKLGTGQDSEAPLTKSITIDPKVLDQVTEVADGYKFDYENIEFRIIATVDAVQDHNPADAMTSAWGKANTVQ